MLQNVNRPLSASNTAFVLNLLVNFLLSMTVNLRIKI